MATSKEIGTTILQQLGGGKFRAMTGAKNFGTDGNNLSFSLPRFSGLKVNRVVITLNSMDTYDIDFMKVSHRLGNHKVETIHRSEGIYNDMLQSVFTKYTGLDTHL